MTSTIQSLLEQSKPWADAELDSRISSQHVLFGTPDSGIEDQLYLTDSPMASMVSPRPVTANAMIQLGKLYQYNAYTRFFRKNLIPEFPGATGMIMNHFRNVNGRGRYFPPKGSPEDALGAHKKVFVREVDPIEGYYDQRTVRAMFGRSYTPINVHRILELLQELEVSLQQSFNDGSLQDTIHTSLMSYDDNDSDFEIVTMPNGPDGIFTVSRVNQFTPDNYDFGVTLNMMIRAEGREFRPGVAIKGSETRPMSEHFLPYTYDEICKNGLRRYFTRSEANALKKARNYTPYVWHIGDSHDIEYAAMKAMRASAGGTVEVVAGVREAARTELLRPENILDAIITAAVPEEKRDEVRFNAIEGMEGARSFFGLVNGVTAAAHTTEDLDSDTVHKLETVGGEALVRRDLARERSGELTEAGIESLFRNLAGAPLLDVDEDAIA